MIKNKILGQVFGGVEKRGKDNYSDLSKTIFTLLS